jgi:hypothetical protein
MPEWRVRCVGWENNRNGAILRRPKVIVAFGDHRTLIDICDTSAPKGAWRADNSIPFLHVFFLVCGPN